MADALVLRGRAGDDRKGEAGRIDRFGSSANGIGFDIIWLEFPSVRESTSDCGPNEKEEPIEWRGRELDGVGRFGIAGIAKLC